MSVDEKTEGAKPWRATAPSTETGSAPDLSVPIIPTLGLFQIEKSLKGSSEKLSEEQKDTVNHVLKAYGDKTAQWLSDLTRMEKPWIEARKGLEPEKES